MKKLKFQNSKTYPNFKVVQNQKNLYVEASGERDKHSYHIFNPLISRVIDRVWLNTFWTTMHQHLYKVNLTPEFWKCYF